MDVVDAVSYRSTHHQVAIHRNEVIAQLIGEEYFTLLEAAISERYRPKPGIRLYIGKDVPRGIIRIIGRISYNDLTDNAKLEMENVVQKIVESNEQRFVNFFNTCNPISPRLHALELIPGIGKKLVQKILTEREKKLFENFEDIRARGGLPDPVKAVTKRIMEELTGQDTRYYLFIREPPSYTEGKPTRGAPFEKY